MDTGSVVPSGFMYAMGYFGTWVFVAASVASRGGVAPEQTGRALAERAAVTMGGEQGVGDRSPALLVTEPTNNKRIP